MWSRFSGAAEEDESFFLDDSLLLLSSAFFGAGASSFFVSGFSCFASVLSSGLGVSSFCPSFAGVGSFSASLTAFSTSAAEMSSPSSAVMAMAEPTATFLEPSPICVDDSQASDAPSQLPARFRRAHPGERERHPPESLRGHPHLAPRRPWWPCRFPVVE